MIWMSEKTISRYSPFKSADFDGLKYVAWPKQLLELWLAVTILLVLLFSGFLAPTQQQQQRWWAAQNQEATVAVRQQQHRRNSNTAAGPRQCYHRQVHQEG